MKIYLFASSAAGVRSKTQDYTRAKNHTHRHRAKDFAVAAYTELSCLASLALLSTLRLYTNKTRECRCLVYERFISRAAILDSRCPSSSSSSWTARRTMSRSRLQVYVYIYMCIYISSIYIRTKATSRYRRRNSPFFLLYNGKRESRHGESNDEHNKTNTYWLRYYSGRLPSLSHSLEEKSQYVARLD